MKQVLLLAAAGLIVTAGCNQGTTGGPGAVPPRSEESKVTTTTNDGMTKTTVTKETEATADADEHTFTVDVPNTETDLKRGESKSINIGVDRGDKMESQDITLKFTNLPAGVTVEPANPTVKAGMDEAPIIIAAKTDAMPGDFTVHVEASAGSGPPATNEFKISINET